MAARCGWSTTTLDIFCRERGIGDEERRRRWPDGIRSLGRQLNAYADAQTRIAFPVDGATPLSAVLSRRFEANEPLKAAVLRLAASDLLHPLDTLDRTASSAVLFWRCHDHTATRAISGLRIGALVVLYSAAVLVWFCDRPPAYRRLRSMIRFAAFVLGTR